MPCGYVYSTEAGARVQAVGVVTHILREASALLVQLTGQCEGLQLWNEQQVRLSRFFSF